MSKPTEFRYSPDGETLRRFHQSDDFVRVLMGPLGSAKTTACCAEIWRRACEQEPYEGLRQSRWLVVRNTYPELMTTTIKSWQEMFGPEFGKFTMGTPPLHQIKVDLADGTKVHLEVYFLAMDGEESVKKLLSFECTGIYLNEAKELPRAVLDMGTGRVDRFPPVRRGGPTWTGVIADTNMMDDDHWLYHLAESAKIGLGEGERPPNWSFYRQPGAVKKVDGKWALNPDRENSAWLGERYYQNQLGGKRDDWVKVYLGAEYGNSFDGKAIFPEFIDSFHVGEFDVFDGDAGFGVDFGLTPAAVFGQRDILGRWLIFDELVTEDMGAVRFAEHVGRKLRQYGLKFNGWGDPAGEQRSQVDERTPFQVMQTEKIPIKPAPTNDATIRRESVAKLLERIIDGKPALLIHPRCKRLRKALAGGYCYRRVRIANEERYQDKPDKNMHSHVAEALEYLLIGSGEGRSIVKRPVPKHSSNGQTRMISSMDQL